MSNIILITGGARSGKSTYAENLAKKLLPDTDKSTIAYFATAEKMDKEFQERIEIHQERRGKQFLTYEEPLAIHSLLEKNITKHDVFIVECLTTWLGNIFFKLSKDKQSSFINGTTDSIIKLFKNYQQKTLILVSNEIGLGLVPADAESRLFRDLQGRLNQKIATNADKVFFIISGIELCIKG
jgi:adenosylcobinamide kinase / adenosylcobinamide-phosphate guanylyltransferase